MTISIIYSIYFHVKYTDLMKFTMCKFFTSFLFSISLFFPLWTFVSFSLPEWTPILKYYKSFSDAPYLIQSTDASEFMDFSNLSESFLYFKHVERILQHDLGHKQVSTYLTKKIFEHLQFIVQCMVIFFHLKNSVYRKILKSRGIVMSNKFVFSTSIIHTGG